MKKILSGAAVFVVGVICGLIFTYGQIYAQDPVKESDIMPKLNEISKNQAEMAAVINSMQEDVRIIKLRITQMQ